MLRTIRITLAAVMFIGITLLFLDITGTMHQWVGWMPKLQLLEAVLALNLAVVAFLVVLTLICGRIYCSIICPLGVMQDVFGWLGKKTKKNRYTYSNEKRWLRYSMLAVFLVALVAGVGVVFQFLAPYSIYGRIVTYWLQPVWVAGNNVLASIAEYYDSYAFYRSYKEIPNYYLITTITSTVLFFIAILAIYNGRTYCNTICPVGTILSLMSRFSLLKINFDVDKCKNCSLCTKNCKASCIDYKTHTVDYSRCVVCGNCIGVCKHGALKYDHARLHDKAHQPVDPSKRSFLLASAMLTTAAMAQEKKKVDGGLAEIKEKAAPERQTPLTPPGSRSRANFEQHCTGCQLCISECPNNVLRPSSDLMHFMLPTMSYELGYCRPECNRCSQVCPAGAIKPLAPELKASTQIGHAVFIKKNCVAITDEVECGNCARHCPTGAIEMVPSDPDDEESAYIPAINEQRCIGCGACENLCPARPFSAIYVEGHEVHKEV